MSIPALDIDHRDPRDHRNPLRDTAEWKRLQCSFCGKDAVDVRFLTAGVFGGMICDRCCVKALLIFVRAHLVSAFKLAVS
jgi:hypothetical protein